MGFENALAEEIWTAKYRFAGSGERDDADCGIDTTIARVARAVAKAEVPELREQWRERFAEALTDFRFIPAGRILAGAGTDRTVTLFNCFVMGAIPDSLNSIFEDLGEAAVIRVEGCNNCLDCGYSTCG